MQPQPQRQSLRISRSNSRKNSESVETDVRLQKPGLYIIKKFILGIFIYCL